MRWLFAMLIVLFCWTSSVSGQNFYAAQTKATLPALTAQAASDEPVLSPYDNVYLLPNELRRKSLGKLLLLLPRIHTYSSSLLSPTQLVPAYTLATELGYRPRPQQLADASIPRQLSQANWVLHFPRQQSRLGGWKESNMLYCGSLTYHS